MPAPRELMSPIPPRFRRIECLGEGRTGTVYLVEERQTGRLFALKALASHYDDRAVGLLREEYAAIKHLAHPGLGQVEEFATTPAGAQYLVREFVPGTRLRPGPPPPRSAPAEFLRPILDVLATLVFLHRNGVLHLDLHPGNVIERTDGRGVLIDVGFVPPRDERCERMTHAGQASDIYAAGLLLLHRLTGQSEKSAAPIAPVSGWDDRLRLHLERVVTRALSADPALGFSSAHEFLRALADVLGLDARELLSPGESHRFVGHEKAIEAIDRLLLALKQGQAHALWASGPPGSGKTRFLAEIRSRAELRGFQSCQFRFFPEAPFRSDLIGDLLPAAARGPVLQKQRAPEALASLFLGALAAPSGGATGEVVLTFDDVQNADRTGRAFVLALFREIAQGAAHRCAVVAAGSSAPPVRDIPAITLRPLPNHDAGRLLEQLTFPLALEPRRARDIVRLTRGNPGLIMRAARALRRIASASGDGDRPAVDTASILRDDIGQLDDDSRSILHILSLFARPVNIGELARATGLSAQRAARTLAGLAGFVKSEGKGSARHCSYFLAGDSLRAELAGSLALRKRRQLHLACARAVEKSRSPRTKRILLADLVRHYALAGRLREARASLGEAVKALVAEGSSGAACRLIALLLERERALQPRIDLALFLSDCARQSGYHDLALEALSKVASLAPPRAALGILRRMGAHALKLGKEGKALSHFRRVLAEADPRRDLEELIEVNAEIADLHVSRGDFAEAERACRRGLELLAGARARDAHAAREAELTLRATAGRFHLRRLEFDAAIVEFRRALRLARELRDVEPQALMLNNLAVTYNQRNDLARARSTFLAAERLSRTRGHGEALVHIACNLGVIAAKRGDPADAREQISKATRGLAEVPGERPRFLVAQAQTIVAALLGATSEAIRTGEEAARLGTKTGDVANVRYVDLYRAEALIDEARYDDAEKILRRLCRDAQILPLQLRMAGARRAFLLSLLGRGALARRILRALDGEERSSVAYVEAGNDCYAGLAIEGCGDDGRRRLAGARDAFRDLAIPFGEARCAVALLAATCRHRDESALRPLLHQVESWEIAPHARLDVERPLACGEACLRLGEVERARRHLAQASSAVVGRVFPELDLRLEAAEAQLAALSGDLAAARQHLHRALTLRSHLADQLAAQERRRFLGQERWQYVRELEASLFCAPSAEAAATAAVTPPRSEETFGLIARSAAMQELLRQIRQVGQRDLSVLVHGPSGSGKDLVAQAIHEASARRAGPFVAIHVPSIQHELFEAELFGFVRGAFTGAEQDRAGLLAVAGKGTVVFDEIAGLAPESQAKLLRVLDRRELRPVGGADVIPIDVRFLFTTSKDLRESIARERFREDLYWRIAQAEIAVPPLADRSEDLPELIALLVKKHMRLGQPPPTVTPDVVSFLARRRWPGNVRQLETVLVRAMLARSPQDALSVEALEQVISSPRPPGVFSDEIFEHGDLETLKRELEIAWLRKTFFAVKGSMVRLARATGLTRAGLYVWLRRLGVDADLWREELERGR